jgi:hypothetical protein
MEEMELETRSDGVTEKDRGLITVFSRGKLQKARRTTETFFALLLGV